MRYISSQSRSNELAALGIKIDEVNPITTDFKDILDRIKDSGANVSQVLKILGLESGPKMVALFQKGGIVLDEFKKKQDAANDAMSTSIIRLDNLDGDIARFNSAVSEIKLFIFDDLNDSLRFIVQSFTTLIGKTKTFISFIKDASLRFQLLQTNIDSIGLAIEQSINSAIFKAVNMLADLFKNILPSGLNLFIDMDSIQKKILATSEKTTKEYKRQKASLDLQKLALGIVTGKQIS